MAERRRREPEIRMRMLSQPRLLAAARAMVSNLAQRLGFNEVACGQIGLAVDEALCNVINHGYQRRPDQPIWLHVWADPQGRPGLRIVVEDRARQVDPETIRPRDLADVRPGGLGVYIIREVMDEVLYERRPLRGMRLVMIKHLPADDAEQQAAPGGTPAAQATPAAAGETGEQDRATTE